jgi:hypothetical protein
MPGIFLDHVTVDELAGDFLRDYKIKATKSFDKAERNVRLSQGSIWRDGGQADHHRNGKSLHR